MTLTSSLGRGNIIGLYVWSHKILEDFLLRPEAAVSIFRGILLDSTYGPTKYLRIFY
jgi:hypothetical protein